MAALLKRDFNAGASGRAPGVPVYWCGLKSFVPPFRRGPGTRTETDKYRYDPGCDVETRKPPHIKRQRAGSRQHACAVRVRAMVPADRAGRSGEFERHCRGLAAADA